MGKDQELLDAARNGNVCVVEKLLSQRAKRSGPLASLRRGPGANAQDTSGYTPLHHAALNGHKDIVTLLLNHDASPNYVDHKGSSPIHLGAWTGNTEIVKLLLIHSNVPPLVNLTNGDGDTPLHCAAQYGHVEVVNLLLQHQCDPTVRNNREESALDLAAQYGRLDTVEALLRTHPELLTAYPTSTRHHSALHLASRNGHKEVVKVLLTFGFPINTLTENGSGLHEAATFGKIDVVRLLLENGINLDLEDCQHRTALEILNDLNTQKAIEIAAVIKNHSTLVSTADSDLCNANTPSSKQNSTSSSDNYSIPKWSSFDGPNPLTVSPCYGKGSQHYQMPPRTPRSNSFDSENCRSSDISRMKLTPERMDFRSIKNSDTSSIYQIPPPPREVDDMSIGSSYDTLPTSRDSGDHTYINQRASLPEGDPYLIYQVPPPPRDAYKRISDPLSDGPISDIDGKDRSDLYVKPLPLSGYVSMNPSQAPPRFLKPPQKPPRKVASPHSPTKYQVQIGPVGMAYEYLCLASTGNKSEQESNSGDSIYENDEEVVRRMTQSGSAIFKLDANLPQMNDNSHYVDMKLRHSFVPNYENEIPYFKNNTSSSETERDVASNKSGDKRFEPRQDYLTTPDDDKQARVNEARTPPKTRVLPCGPKPVIPPRPKSVNELHAITTVPEQSHQPTAQKPKSLDLDGKPYPPISRKPIISPKIQQLPTPDFPPPSPGTAELGIHEKMRPLSQDYKRRSCDTETFTEDEVFLSIEENHQGQLKLTVSTANKSVSTEKIESCSDSYAGLRKGCVPTSSSSGESEGENCRFKTGCLSPECSNADLGYSKSNKNMNNAKSRSAFYENVTLNFDRSPRSDSRYLAITPDSTISRGNMSSRDHVFKEDITSPFDEVAEWSKINDILATFGNPTKSNMDTFKGRSHYENINGCGVAKSNYHQDMSSVGLWLSKLGLSFYENLFLINGFDDLQFMGGDMIEDQDLIDIGIKISEHRKILVKASKLLPALKPIRRINEPSNPNKSRIPGSVKEWLQSIHLENYVDTFLRHKFNDMERILKMWEVELTTVLEITKIGHKKRILGSLGDRPVSPKLYDVSRLSSDLSTLKQEISQMDQIVKSGNETIKRQRQKPKAPVPPQVPTNDTTDNKGIPTSSNRASVSTPSEVEISVRDPSHLFSGIPNSLTTQWRHRPDSLINGSCEYLSKYLGSTVIKELKGIESSKRSIQKLKKATSDIARIPNVILAISYKGVKFIDTVTKNEICEHDIRNINCACQDSDHLDHFAYITKDHATGNHYCHVFSVATMDMATELILTLGQAFEVAYQIALKENGMAHSPGITPSPSTSSSLPLLSISKNGPMLSAMETSSSKTLSPEVVKIAEFPTSNSSPLAVSPSRG